MQPTVPINITKMDAITDGIDFTVKYAPGEAETFLFGGNSNWRGPIWFPVNYLIIESLHRFHHYYGDEFKVEHPTGSGNLLTLKEIASMTGGEFYSATSAAELQGVFQHLYDYVALTNQKVEVSVGFVALGVMLAIAAFILSLHWHPLV